MQKTLERIGVSKFGYMEDFDKSEVIVQFQYRDWPETIRASGKGYAAMWLHRHPWNYRLRISKTAVYSILRDWIKGQVIAIETGILSFEGAFLGQLMLPTGETVLERIERDNVLGRPPPSAAH